MITLPRSGATLCYQTQLAREITESGKGNNVVLDFQLFDEATAMKRRHPELVPIDDTAWEFKITDERFWFIRYKGTKINGTNEMEDWTLTQWAEEFGWKEYRSLRQYNEQTERDYIYNKYLPIERAINKIASRKYVLNEYDCKHFSLDLKIELEKENISSKMITGFGNTSGHRWLAIEIDPTSGRFVETNEFNNEFPIQSLTKKYLRSINR